MNFKQINLSVLFLCFFISANVFAEDLKIEEGKNLKFDFKGSNSWYDDQKIYDNVNIGAGSKVVLGNEWQYVFVSSSVEVSYSKREIVNPDGTTHDIIDETTKTTYDYRNDENIATLGIAANGILTLNAGSELSIRNQYSLVASTQDVSLEYERVLETGKETILFKEGHLSNQRVSLFPPFDELIKYEQYDKDGNKIDKYENREIKADLFDFFTGQIVFESGDVNTVLTFQPVSSRQSDKFKLPYASDDIKTGSTASGGDKIKKDIIEDISVGRPDGKHDIATMTNDFYINSNRAVFNVLMTYAKEEEEWNDNLSSVKLDGKDFSSDGSQNSYISGDGTIVKTGAGVLNLSYMVNILNPIETKYIDATGLTGLNTGYGWAIEEGMIVAHIQKNLGNSKIYIASNGNLGLVDSAGGTTFVNDITFAGGGVSIASNSKITLSGDIDTKTGSDNSAIFTFMNNSKLTLSGNNTAERFLINFGGKSGGEKNYLITDVDGLATKSITVNNLTDESMKEFAFFELELNETEDKEYSGSLQGDMYLHKKGAGIVTLSGYNTYTEGTYITEGGILLANSNAIGTGKILFDGTSSSYASIGVSSITTGDIKLTNDIHVNKGAILNVYDDQNLSLYGSLVNYDARPGFETEFIKTGLGEARIAGKLDSNRQINISSFTVQEGGFALDTNVELDSYFSLNGQQAYLKMEENSGVRKNIDINSGDLIIFNEHNISTATVNFNNASISNLSKFHITSTTVLSNATLQNKINIKRGIEFVIDDTTTANLNAFNFNSGTATIISKSGDGNFIFDTNSTVFGLENLTINGGYFTLLNSTMTVSSSTVIDGGILSLGQNSYFESTNTNPSEKKIKVLNGGIGIYDDNNIKTDTLLSFEGTDPDTLSRLLVEAADVNLTNNIFVKMGVVIENKNDLTISGNSITYDSTSSGIFAKAGAGKMIISQTSGGAGFNMGEIRVLEGNMDVSTNVNVSTVSVMGQNAIMNIKNSTMTVLNDFSISNNGLLILSTSTLKALNVNLFNSTMTVMQNSIVNATNVNVNDGAFINGFGKINSTVNLKENGSIYVGKKDEIDSFTSGSTNFSSDSSLYMDVKSVSGVTSSDKLEVIGDITVAKDVNLYVNLLGDESEYDTTKSFELITFTGNNNFINSTNEIFDIILSNARFSANTSLIGKSIFLEIAKEWSLYELPGTTENQQSMINSLNNIYNNQQTRENFKSTLSTLDTLYGNYKATGNKAPFLNAVQDLSGIFYANSFMASALLSKVNMVYNRLSDFAEDRGENNVWAQVYTNSFSIDKNEDNPKFENSIVGLIAGYDTVKADDFIIGFAGFYGTGEFKQIEDKANINDAGVNAYLSYKYEDNIEIKALAGYAMQDYDATRKIRFLNDSEIKSKYSVNTLNFDVEAAYKHAIGKQINLKPIVGANCAVVSNSDISENGSLEQKLRIDSNSYTKAEVRLGVGLQSNNRTRFNWYLSALAKQIINGDKFTMTASFDKIPNEKFEIQSTKLSSTIFSGNLGCLYSLTENLNLFVDLSSDTSSSSSMMNANFGASYRW